MAAGRRVHRPERSETTYAFRSLLDTGRALAFGSDWFVAPPTPIEGIYAAVTRRRSTARPGGWVPQQKITVEEALRAYTRGGAYASFNEKQNSARSSPGSWPMSSSSTVISARSRRRRLGRRAW